jgi:uncharacterized protein
VVRGSSEAEEAASLNSGRKETFSMPRVVHFETPVQDADRAGKFYSEVFGWKVSKWDGPQEYWLISTGEEGHPGIDGAFMQNCTESPMSGPVNTIDVPSVDEYLEKITANGGAVAMPKMAVPSVGYLAYAKDTEGTLFGIMQRDPAAA